MALWKRVFRLVQQGTKLGELREDHPPLSIFGSSPFLSLGFLTTTSGARAEQDTAQSSKGDTAVIGVTGDGTVTVDINTLDGDSSSLAGYEDIANSADGCVGPVAPAYSFGPETEIAEFRPTGKKGQERQVDTRKIRFEGGAKRSDFLQRCSFVPSLSCRLVFPPMDEGRYSAGQDRSSFCHDSPAVRNDGARAAACSDRIVVLCEVHL